jgi:diguanylate cyclase (GGDEF)-like protein
MFREAVVLMSGLSTRLLDVDSDDPTLARRGRNALIVFTGAIACGIPSLVALFFIPHGPGLSVIIAVFCICAALCTRLVHRGKVDLGIGLFFVVMLAAELAFPIVSQDSRLTAVYLVIPVAIAGVTLERRGLMIVALTSMVIAVTVTVVYPPLNPPPTTLEVILAALILIGFLIVVTWLGSDSLRREAARADAAAARERLLARGLADANEELEARVARRTEELEFALTRQEVLVAELAELSLRDPLTGLYNRRHADHELPRLLAAADRYGHPMAMAMADLDHFKAVNDDHTYAVGDEVLRRFATILEQTCRTTDVVTRYGGEEFLVMMPQTSVEQGHVVCERLRREVERHPWHEVVAGLTVTVSIGIADTAHAGGLVTLVAASDTALHRAKRDGRNRVVAATGEPHTRVVAHGSDPASHVREA